MGLRREPVGVPAKPQRPFCQVKYARRFCGEPPAYEAVVTCEVDDQLRVRTLCLDHAIGVRLEPESVECTSCRAQRLHWHQIIFKAVRTYRPAR